MSDNWIEGKPAIVRIFDFMSYRVYRVTKEAKCKPVIERFWWSKCTYVPVNSLEEHKVLWTLKNHYRRIVKNSGIKDLDELDKKKILTKNNFFYELIVNYLKSIEHLPCSEEEKRAFHPISDDVLRAVKFVKCVDSIPEDVLKEKLYEAYKLTLDGKIANIRAFVKETLNEHPEYKDYPEYQAAEKDGAGEKVVEFLADILVDGVYHS